MLGFWSPRQAHRATVTPEDKPSEVHGPHSAPPGPHADAREPQALRGPWLLRQPPELLCAQHASVSLEIRGLPTPVPSSGQEPSVTERGDAGPHPPAVRHPAGQSIVGGKAAPLRLQHVTKTSKQNNICIQSQGGPGPRVCAGGRSASPENVKGSGSEAWCWNPVASSCTRRLPEAPKAHASPGHVVSFQDKSLFPGHRVAQWFDLGPGLWDGAPGRARSSGGSAWDPPSPAPSAPRPAPAPMCFVSK